MADLYFLGYLFHCSLEVTLEKVKEGQWACLLKEEGQLPLSEGLSQECLSKEELEELERKIKEVSSATSTANSAQEVHLMTP